MNIYNKLLENIILPIGDSITGGSFMSELKKWRKIQNNTECEIEELSKNNLINILEYTTENIPFYKEMASKKCQDPYVWIKNFPIMYKKDIKENLANLSSVPLDDLIKCSSSGSSGVQGAVYVSKHERDISRAIQFMWWEWSGIRIGKKILQTGMTPNRGFIKYIKDIIFRTRYRVAFGLCEIEILEILGEQKNKNNYNLGGYASSLYLLANECVKHNIENVRFDGAISWGDKMFPHYRKRIMEAFGCRVLDTYGCSEGTMIACQKDLEYYYIMSPHVYLELLDKHGNEVQDGELGYVVVTRLDNFSMPLIRYYNGDLAVKLPKEKYPLEKELNFPLLERIIGRDTDIVRTKSGKYMIVHFFTGIFEFYEEINQFKVIQRNLDSIEIEYIPGDGFNARILDKIEAEIMNYLNEPFEVSWKEVNSINPTPSGKPQIIQSFIAK